MKIWHFDHYATPPTRPGVTRQYSFARELVRLGHRVTLIAAGFDHRAREVVHLRQGVNYKIEVIQEVPFLWVRAFPYRGNSLRRVMNMISFAWRAYFGVSRYLPPPDVIVGTSPNPFAAWIAYWLARRYRVPFVLEVRDLWPQTLIDLGGFSPHHPFILLLAWIENFLYRRAHAIVTLLPGGADYIVSKVGRTQGVYWIPNGVDFALLPPPEPPPPAPPFTVMYAGAHGLANGLEVALRAAQRLQEMGWGERIHFRFIGDGPEKPRLCRLAQRLGLQNVTFEEPVPKSQVYQRLQEAHAFLMTLRDSPLFHWGVSPNKLFDFMAMARPVLFCVRTPYDPVSANQAGVVVPPDDPKALAQAIQELAQTSPDIRWEMGLRGRAYVQSTHNLRDLALKFEVVLRSVVGE